MLEIIGPPRHARAGPTTEGGGVMQKWLMGKAHCQDILVQYYLLKGENRSYGVSVETERETAQVLDLTPSRQKAECLANSLARGAVTPVCLRDVVDDWLLK